MKAFIYYNSKSKGLDYNRGGEYVLVTEDNKCLGGCWCLSRAIANHDLTAIDWRLKALRNHKISEVYSNGKLIWKDGEMTDDAKNDFHKANASNLNIY